MIQIPKTLQQIINYIEETHLINKFEIKRLQDAYKYAQETFFQSVTNEYNENDRLNHSMAVAHFIASWQFDSSVVLASLLHEIPVYNSSLLSTIKTSFGEIIYSILADYLSIYNQFQYYEINDTATNLDTLLSLLQSTHSSAFYIFIAKRICLLSEIQDGTKYELARQTRKLLIPRVKEIHAYRISDILEELCLQIENPHGYYKISSVVHELNSRNCFYKRQFINKLEKIFYNSNKSLLPTSKDASPHLSKKNDIYEYEKYIKQFLDSERSVISLHRYITRHDSSQKDDWKKLKDVHRTAFHNLTLVVMDNFQADSGKSSADLFLCYYEKYLQYDGVTVYGYYHTTKKDSCYFLISDKMKNLYRVFIKTEKEHLQYMYGNIVNNDDIRTNFAYQDHRDRIKVFRKDGHPQFVDNGTTVLDFAFLIHEDIGLKFAYAILNHNSAHLPANTLLNYGDTVDIKTSNGYTADIGWFRFINSNLARNYLVKFFRKNYFHNINGELIRIVTKDGSVAEMEEGSTVLDYAFFVHSEMGLHFDYAIVNDSKKHVGVEYRLKNNDKVVIIMSNIITANYNWFRHLKTHKALDHLIHYYKHKDS